MNISWVRIRSWHAIRASRSFDLRTLCGRSTRADAEVSDELPAGKSCETCLRIIARKVDV